MLEATWRTHANGREFARKLTTAHQVVDDALHQVGPRAWFAGISGGKDSLALAWLLHEHGCASTARFAHASCELLTPGMTDCAEKVAAKYGVEIDVFDPDFDPYPDVWAFLRSIAHLSRDQMCHELFRRCASGNMLVAYSYATGRNGAFSGMRAEESRGRTLNRKARGSLYKITTDSSWMCNPIGDWTSRDVWAAITIGELEAPHHYRRILERFGTHPETQNSRVDSVVVSEKINGIAGAMMVTRVLYPELWSRIHAANPTIAR